MSEVTFKIDVPTDDDGFLTLQCPFCSERFKLTVQDFEREDIIDLFCPYCGLKDEPSSFITDEIIEQAHILALNYAKSQINKSIKGLEQSSRGNKNISFKAGKPLEMEGDKVLFEKEQLELITLKCCELETKAKSIVKEIGVYCPCCGVK
ncbi:conserved hypothetical protein [Hyella patelloides LEGE 07179]|uniref:TFIIB-type zinc ribbon-containing protein n=2 Tax=Hyella TaxID=945733 RepID=A0A563VXH1_9CYAN|nr:conserved hypothetical protein [Hyella patelloides LEGE 07179]